MSDSAGMVRVTREALDAALKDEEGRSLNVGQGKSVSDRVWQALVAADQAGPRPPMMAMISMMGLYEELDWLRDHGALAGVMAIMHARRYQVEQGYTPAHDREHRTDGWLLGAAHNRLQSILDDIGTEASSPAWELDGMAAAAALAAAEIDRLDAEARKARTHD